MNKRIISIILAVVLCIVMVVPVSVNAEVDTTLPYIEDDIDNEDIDPTSVDFSCAYEEYVAVPESPAAPACSAAGESVEKCKYGDVDGDGALTVGDVALISRVIVCLDPTSEEKETLGDVNGNSGLDTGDALLVLQKAARIIDKFPVEK